MKFQFHILPDHAFFTKPIGVMLKTVLTLSEGQEMKYPYRGDLIDFIIQERLYLMLVIF